MRLKAAIYAIAVLAATNAGAQTLSTEITVDRIVEPAMRDAYRPVWVPKMLAVPAQTVSLRPAEYTEDGTIVNSRFTIPAAMWRDTVMPTPYKGYASAGYFPGFNLGANAGYRFVDRPTAKVGAWMQYDGNKYTKTFVNPVPGSSFVHDMTLGGHFVNVGVDASVMVNQSSLLSVDVAYQYSSVIRPSMTLKEGYKQGSNQVDLNAGLHSQAGNIAYSVAARAQYFGFGENGLSVQGTGLDSPLKQTMLGIEGNVGLCREGERNPWLGIRLNGDLLHSNDTTGTRGLLQFRPYAAFGNKAFSLNLGVNLSYGSSATIAPDVRVSWVPENLPLSGYVNFGGGQYLNPVSKFFAIDPCVATHLPAVRSNVKYDILGGINVGPVAGFSLKVHGGYANVDNAHMPVLSPYSFIPVWTSAYGGTPFAPFDVKCWTVGAALSYDVLGYALVSVGYDTSGSGSDGMGWYTWYDNAKNVISASAAIKPIDKLDVNIDYELRTDRHALPARVVNGLTQVDLGNMSNLCIGASYKITPAITAFARVENILGGDYLLVSGLPAQGVKGLIGAAIKF